MRKTTVLSLVLLLAASSLAPAETRLVPDDYPNIQAAISEANDGDIIIVAPNTYKGDGNRDIDFLGKAITVRSTDPNDPDIVASTVINCNGTQAHPYRGFLFRNSEGPNSVLAGLTIINGYSWELTIAGVDFLEGDAIFSYEASPTIKNCIISNSLLGGAVLFYSGSPTIANCTISNNAGGAIYANEGAVLVIINCLIEGNSAETSGGALYCGEFTSSVITSSNVTGNSTNAQGAGIYCAPDANMIIADCTIAGCTANGDGGGIYCAEGSNVLVTNCTIVDNATAENGGGIYFGQAAPFVANSTITGNTADNQGGGIYCAAGIIIDNSLVAGNSSDTGGGIYSHDGINLIENCTFAANKAVGAGGGLFCYFPSGYSWPYDDLPPEFEGQPWGREPPPPPPGPPSYSNILNSIFWDNAAQSGPQIAAESAYTPAPPTWPPLPSPDPPVWYPDWPDWMDRFRNPTGLPDKQAHLIVTDWPSRTRPSLPDWPEWPFPVPPDFPWPPNLPWPPTTPQPPEFPPLPSPPPRPPHPRVMKITYSDIAGGKDNVYTDSQWNLTWGAGNADTDPCFVDPGCWTDANDPCIIVEPNDPNAIWIEGDYHLLATSPCIDTGDPNYVPGPNETDLAGRPRVLDGNEDGIAAVDMGAYEFLPAIEAAVEIRPPTLNLASRGKWVMCYIWLPEDYNVADIEPNSVLLEEEIKADRVWFDAEFAIAKFSRPALQDMLVDLETPTRAELIVSGRLNDGTRFEGIDTVRVINRARSKKLRSVKLKPRGKP